MDSRPVFIPRGTDVNPDLVRRGYVAHSDGLVRWDKSFQKPFSSALKKIAVQHQFETETREKRTAQARLESLSQRIFSQMQKTGLGRSLYEEIQTVAWKEGQPISYDQAMQLASHFLGNAERNADMEQAKRVTRKDPHRADPGR